MGGFFTRSELLYIPYYDMAHIDGTITASLSLLQKLFIILIFLLNISFHLLLVSFFYIPSFYLLQCVMFNVLQETSVHFTG